VTVTIRAMNDDDIPAATGVQMRSFLDLDRREGLKSPEITDALLERQYSRHQHFVTHDPGGSWVATEDDRVVGVALALKRDTYWGLSLLAVDPDVQSAGTGRKLLDASLTYAADCDRAVILSSTDSRAMRAYARSGFDLYPQVAAKGSPDSAALPILQRVVREGSIADADRLDQIDREVRGAPRGPCHARMAAENLMFVIDDAAGRGYVYARRSGDLVALSATDEPTSIDLFWRWLAVCVELGKPAMAEYLHGGQQWAIRTAYAARLTVSPSGPVFWRGITPPATFIPSGAYL
jgi:GNAT superfamily N-acetyltransferase